MKTVNLKTMVGKITAISFICAILVFLSSCATKMSFGNSAVMPSAEGTVKIKTDKNGNNAIDIKVIHLASAEKLTPPRKLYVVWMVTENNETKNLGRLKSSSSLLSKTLKGSLETTSPFKPLSFFITAEDDASTQYPDPTIVLNTK